MISTSYLRRLATVVSLAIVFFAFSATNAFATHLRGTTLSWTSAGPGGLVTFKFEYAQRTTFSFATASTPTVGTSFVLPVAFNFGDNQTAQPTGQITSVNVAEDWFIAEYTFSHQYSAAGPFTAFYTNSARVSTIILGHDQTMRMETTVLPQSGNRSPVAAMPPIITVPIKAVTGFVVSASDSDRDTITYRLASALEAYGTALVGGIGGNGTPPGLSIDSTTGQVTWNTSALVSPYPAPANGQLWTVQFMAEDHITSDPLSAVKSKTPIDVILKFVTSVGNPPTLTFSPVGPLSIQAGSPVTFTVTANDVDANARVTLNASGAPTAAAITNLNQSLIPPVVSTFTWTPTLADGGTHVIGYTATDDTFQQTLGSITIFVENNLPPTIACPAPFSVPYQQFAALTASVADPNGDALTVVFNVDGSTVQTTGVPASQNTSPVSLSQMWGAIGPHNVFVTVTDPKNASANCSTTVTVTQANQTITFGPLQTRTYGDPTFAVNATSDSGLPVSFSVVSGPAFISGGNNVNITGTGFVTIRASQAGNTNYNPAPNVDQQFNVMLAVPGLTLTGNPNPSTYGQAVLIRSDVFGVLTDPGGSVSLNVDGLNLGVPIPITNFLSATAGFVTFNATDLSVGTHTVIANYSGDANLSPGSVTSTLVVNPPPAPPFSQILPTPAGGCICSPAVMNSNVHGAEEWFVKADATGSVKLTVIAQAVNTIDPETVTANVFDGAGTLILGPVTASYAVPLGNPYEVKVSNSFVAVPGDTYRVEVTTPGTPGTQPHYRLNFEGAAEAGMASPGFASFEAQPSKWFFNVGAGENLDIRVFSNGVPMPIPPVTETFQYRLIDPSGNAGPLVTLSSLIAPGIDQTISVPGAAAGIWTLQVVNLNEHYRLSKVSGADTGIYLTWQSSGTGSVHGTITSGGLPFTSGFVTINLLAPDGSVILTQGGNTGAYRFDNVPVGPVTVQIVPGPGVSAVTPSLSVNIICGQDAEADFVISSADLSITKTASPNSTVPTSGQLTYTVTVTNNGPGAASSVAVSDSTPFGTAFVSLTTTAGSCSTPPTGGSGPVNCSLGTLASGSSVTITVKVDVTTLPGPTLTTNASVNSPTFDPNHANNSATTSNTVAGCDLVVTNQADSGAHSLRLAMQCANANFGLDTITFNIPGAGLHTIQPVGSLPNITDPLVINGYSQPGASVNTLTNGDNAVLLIEINGSSAGGSGFSVNAPGSTLKGLVINRFAFGGISLNSGGNLVAGNFIGTNATGTAAALNGNSGVNITAGSGNVIGGATVDARNVISGNNGSGVFVNAPNTVILNNYIGTNASGTAAIANTNTGITAQASGTIIGNTGSGNIVSGNNGVGVSLNTTGNSVAGNKIGVNVNNAPLTNGTNQTAVNISASSNTVGPNNTILSGGLGVGANITGGNITDIHVNNNISIVGGATNHGVSISGASVGNPAVPNSVEVKGNATITGGDNGIGLNATAGQITQVVITGNGTITGGPSGGTRHGIGMGQNPGTTSINNLTISGNFSIASNGNGNGISLFSQNAANITVDGNTSITGNNGVGINGFQNATYVASNLFVTNNGSIKGTNSTGVNIGSSSPGNLSGLKVNGNGSITGGNRGVSVISSAGTNGSSTYADIQVKNNATVQSTFLNSTGISVGGCSGPNCSSAASNINISGNGATGNVSGGAGGGIGIQLSSSGNLSTFSDVTVTGNKVVMLGGSGDDNNGSRGINLYAVALPGHSNLISGNDVSGATQKGIMILAPNGTTTVSGNTVHDNPGIGIGSHGVSIGLNGTGSLITLNNVHDNTTAGIAIEPGTDQSGNVVGTNSGTKVVSNIVFNNGYAGVGVIGGGSVGNTISQNSIYNNGALNPLPLPAKGIDLSADNTHPDGVTLNAPCGPRIGGNNLQNYPVLQSVSSTEIAGTLNSVANTSFTLEFFANVAGASSGYGEGQTYIGSMQVTTDGSCNTDFLFVPSSPVPDGQVVTATATNNVTGDTSEFSNWGTTTTVASNNTPSAFGDSVTITATVNTGSPAAPVSTGTVTFKEGNTVLAGPVLVDPLTGQASFTTTSLAAGSHTITALYIDASNSPSNSTVIQVVHKKTASVTPAAASKVYGSADPGLTGSLSGFLSSDNVTATYSRVAGETVLGGPYTISAVLSPTDVLDNYDITYNTANFTINKLAASVTPAPAVLSKVYGSPDPALSGALSGFLVADGVTATYSRVAGETVLGGPYTITATLSPAGVLSNYDITSNTASLTITAKAASVAPAAASKIFGAADPTLTGTLSGFLAGDSVVATYTRVAGEGVGSSPYTISASLAPTAMLSNYAIAYGTANFTINKATPTTNWNHPADIVYGTALSGTQLNATASVPGTFAYTPTAGTILPAGTARPLSAVFMPTDAVDYNSVPASATINVLRASTSTALATSLTPSALNQAVTLTATVTSGSGVPTGFVTFTDGTTVLGTSPVDATGKATLVTSALLVGVHPITATYNGDSNFVVSTSSAVSQLVYAFPSGPGGGDFVIGNLNAVVGNSVTFWGSQWDKDNSLSGGSAPASFKGFANSTSTTNPAAGGTWSTAPGNSSGPPSSVPAYIAVIVTSSSTKSGSTISGNTTSVVVVKTNAGYDSNPGHAGTGTVVAIVH